MWVCTGFLGFIQGCHIGHIRAQILYIYMYIYIYLNIYIYIYICSLWDLYSPHRSVDMGCIGSIVVEPKGLYIQAK